MLEEVFRCPDGSYAPKNHYFASWSIRDLIAALPAEQRAALEGRVAALRTVYDELSATYQASKDGDAEIPLR